jgi:hypothetical protein
LSSKESLEIRKQSVHVRVEVNREIFFEEEKQAKIDAQRKENEERRRKALEDSKKDSGVADTKDIAKALTDNVHPAEGGAPRDV